MDTSPSPARSGVLLDRLRDRVTATAAEPFGHHRPPLLHTMDHPGDPGLFGPGSATWEVMGRVTTFIGGIRGLLVQACHPEVVAGVHEHSRYRDDPLGRLSRTAHYVTVTSFGAMPEVEEVASYVRRRHRRVAGMSHRGRPYDASAPALSAWVHNALTDSFLTAHQTYSRHPLTPARADEFVAEQTRAGHLLGSSPLPTTAAELSDWVVTHPDLAPSPGMEAALEFLADPPLSPAQRAGYRLLYEAAVATLPVQLLEILGVKPKVVGHAAGIAADRFLRWTMGDSPAWQLALDRVGADSTEGQFRRQLTGHAASGRTSLVPAPRVASGTHGAHDRGLSGPEGEDGSRDGSGTGPDMLVKSG